MNADGFTGYNDGCIGTGRPRFVLPWRNKLGLLLLCPALVISLSCSNNENKAASGSKEPAKKTVSPPPGSMTLSAVLSHLENTGYSPVTEVEFENDHWKIETYSDGRLVQLKVDPVSGAIIPNQPPTTKKPLSAVVKGLEDQGYGPILEIEGGSDANEADAAWEVEAYKGSSEVTVKVEAGSGKITAK